MFINAYIYIYAKYVEALAILSLYRSSITFIYVLLWYIPDSFLFRISSVYFYVD